MIKFYILIVIAIYVGVSSCSTTRVVKPLEKKQVAIGVDLGGPIVDLFNLDFVRFGTNWFLTLYLDMFYKQRRFFVHPGAG